MSEARIPRHSRYQDYVIRDGQLIGEFEELYQDFDNPWEQTERERHASEKFVAIHLLQALGVRRVLELGSGLGQFSAAMASAGFDVRGIEISPTAVEMARASFPGIDFQVGDVLDFEKYREFDPDAIVMAEITWYVLEQLDELLAFLREEFSGRYLVHLLQTYGPGVQQYGRSRFTDLPGSWPISTSIISNGERSRSPSTRAVRVRTSWPSSNLCREQPVRVLEAVRSPEFSK